MLLALKVFVVGCGRALQKWRCALLLYLVNLAFAVLVAAPGFGLARESLAQSGAVRDFLGSYDAFFTGDVFWAHREAFAGAETARAVAAVLFVLVGAFLSAAVFGALAEPDRRAGFAALAAHGARRFWPFLRSLVPAGLVMLLLVPANRAASRGITHFLNETLERSASATTLGVLLVGKTLFFLALFLLLVTAPLQFARARCAADDVRGMLKGYLSGVRLALRRPISVLFLTALVALPPLATLALHDVLVARIDWTAPWRPLHALGWRLDPALPPDLVLLLVEQVLALCFAWALVVRASTFLSYWREHTAPPAPPDPELAYAKPPIVDAPVGGAEGGAHAS